jgi:F-type H+-transporting ATPase subunit delta
MPRISSGKRYAQASFKIALERNELDSWQKGLEKIANLTKEEELMAVLQDPRVPFEVKRSILQKKLGEVNPLVFNLSLLLIEKGLLRIGQKVLQYFNQFLDAYNGIERAKVITAISLDDDEREEISRRLGEMVNRRVLIDGQVDPTIIGGFIARIGDKLIDGSIRQRLEALKKNLAEAEI